MTRLRAAVTVRNEHLCQEKQEARFYDIENRENKKEICNTLANTWTPAFLRECTELMDKVPLHTCQTEDFQLS